MINLIELAAVATAILEQVDTMRKYVRNEIEINHTWRSLSKLTAYCVNELIPAKSLNSHIIFQKIEFIFEKFENFRKNYSKNYL